jgi:hypothetical protein
LPNVWSSRCVTRKHKVVAVGLVTREAFFMLRLMDGFGRRSVSRSAFSYRCASPRDSMFSIAAHIRFDRTRYPDAVSVKVNLLDDGVVDTFGSVDGTRAVYASVSGPFRRACASLVQHITSSSISFSMKVCGAPQRKSTSARMTRQSRTCHLAADRYQGMMDARTWSGRCLCIMAPGSARSGLWHNARAIRRECLDHVVAFGERHFRQLLGSYQRYRAHAPIAEQGCTGVACSSGGWPHRGRPAPRKSTPSIGPD